MRLIGQKNNAKPLLYMGSKNDRYEQDKQISEIRNVTVDLRFDCLLNISAPAVHTVVSKV